MTDDGSISLSTTTPCWDRSYRSVAKVAGPPKLHHQGSVMSFDLHGGISGFAAGECDVWCPNSEEIAGPKLKDSLELMSDIATFADPTSWSAPKLMEGAGLSRNPVEEGDEAPVGTSATCSL